MRTFEEWFNRYRMTTSTFGFEPSNIYNIDETGFQMGDGEHTYVIIDQRVSTEKYATKGDQTENISVIECRCMDGTVLPPFIIFKGKNLQSSWYFENAPED